MPDDISANPNHNDGLAQPTDSHSYAGSVQSSHGPQLEASAQTNPATRLVGSLQVPLSQIHVNPKNPRRVITQEMIDNMAASLDTVGLKNEIKINVLPDGSYELISGHIRLAGAQKLGWKTIPAQLLHLTPEQALLESILDNRGQQMNWLETAEAVESLMQARPKPNQEAVGKMMGIPQQDVSRKMVILNWLTPAARTTIYTKSVKAFETGLIPQKVVAVLVALKDEDLIEKALEVAIDRKMTEAEAQKLVVHVQAGNTPKSYTRAGAPKASNPNTQSVLGQSTDPQSNTGSAQSSLGSQLEPSTQTNHAPQPVVSAQTPSAQSTEEAEPESPAEDESLTWKEMYDHAKATNAMGTFFTMQILVFGIFGGLCWLAWKAVVWGITTLVHWL